MRPLRLKMVVVQLPRDPPSDESKGETVVENMHQIVVTI